MFQICYERNQLRQLYQDDGLLYAMCRIPQKVLFIHVCMIESYKLYSYFSLNHYHTFSIKNVFFQHWLMYIMSRATWPKRRQSQSTSAHSLARKTPVEQQSTCLSSSLFILTPRFKTLINILSK